MIEKNKVKSYFRSCYNCKAFNSLNDKSGDGQCHRHAPNNSMSSAFPYIHKVDATFGCFDQITMASLVELELVSTINNLKYKLKKSKDPNYVDEDLLEDED